MNRTLIIAAALLLVTAPASAAVKSLKPLKTWSGQMPLAIPPLVQSSVVDANVWRQVWATCQMKGAPAEVDFDKRMVLVVVRRANNLKFSGIKLDNGNVTTSVGVGSGQPDHYTCALAMIDRAGVSTVNGQPLGK
jgi:hypothetical protein